LDAGTSSEAWPRAHGQVVILYARGPRVAAHVTSATSLSLLLQVSDRQSALTGGGEGTRVTLEYVSGTRAYRLAGDLHGSEHDHELRFVPRGQPVLLQRREHMRAAVDVMIVLVSTDGALRLVGRTRNVSSGGALGNFPEVPAVGQRLRFSLVSRVGSEVIKGNCQAVRVEASGLVAVEFEGVTSSEAERIADFILRNR
jgi:hypothetical protein